MVKLFIRLYVQDEVALERFFLLLHAHNFLMRRELDMMTSFLLP